MRKTMPDILFITEPVSRNLLREYLLEGTLVKAVVDIDRRIIAIGGGLHADEEQLLLEDGSTQENLWGINLYPDTETTDWIEFDSMINIRPRQGNRSRGIEDPAIQQSIRTIVAALIS